MNLAQILIQHDMQQLKGSRKLIEIEFDEKEYDKLVRKRYALIVTVVDKFVFRCVRNLDCYVNDMEYFLHHMESMKVYCGKSLSLTFNSNI